MSYTIEEKELLIKELEGKIELIKLSIPRPYELVRITFDGHGLRSMKNTDIIATCIHREELLNLCIETFGEEPQEIPYKAKDRKYKTIYHIWAKI